MTMQDEHGDDMIVDTGDDSVVTDTNENGQGEAVQNDNAEGALIDNDEVVNNEGTEAADAEGTEEGSESGGQEGDGGDEGASAQPTEARPTVTEPVAPELVTDPGEQFTPKGDYAFDVELADGTVIHIASLEDVDTIPADADFGTPANLMKAQAKLNTLTTGIENERREWEANKAKFDEQKTANAALEQRIDMMAREVSYLEKKGTLPPLAPELNTFEVGKLWRTPEYKDKPGIKERLALLDYRDNENVTRREAGLPDMTLLEAASEMAGVVAAKQVDEEKKRQATIRKQRGAMVGGSSAAPMSSMPDDIIVGEGGSIRDLNPLY